MNPYREPRGTCPKCGRKVALYLTKDKARKPYMHKNPRGQNCTGRTIETTPSK